MIKINAKELADILGKHPNTIYKDIEKGKIPATKIGKSYEIEDKIVSVLVNKEMRNKTGNNAKQVLSIQTETLKHERRCYFSYFLQELKELIEEFDDAWDTLDRLDWNVWDYQPIMIETLEKLINDFEKGKAFEYFKEYQKITDAVEITEKIKEEIPFKVFLDAQRKEFEKKNKETNTKDEDWELSDLTDMCKEIELE